MSRDYAQSYCRMFPRLAPAAHAEDDLIGLADLMVDDGLHQPQGSLLVSGYLYLAQFLDHDLSLDPTLLSQSGLVPPENRTNQHSPFLDLDSLYGAGPLLSPWLYRLEADKTTGRSMTPGNERFLIGETSPGKQPRDLPRTTAGRPIMGDPRNEENPILAQLHVLFLRFHNHVMDALDEGTGPDVGLQDEPKFAQARRLVTWFYQYIILYDLLPQIVRRDVLGSVLSDYPKRLHPGGRFSIPVEFALAAFRFGHSMVRDDYVISRTHRNAQLDQLLMLNSQADPPLVALPDQWVIDWGFYFPDLPVDGFRNTVHGLDPLIAKALHHLPGPVALESGPHPRMIFSLPAMTLLRGQRSGLPTGQAIAQQLGEKPLTDDEMAGDAPVRMIDYLSRKGLLRNTPLWFYILAEAAAKGEKKYLGPVGSRIVAETVVGALVADPGSILNAGQNWVPPAWPALLKKGPVKDMTGLALASAE